MPAAGRSPASGPAAAAAAAANRQRCPLRLVPAFSTHSVCAGLVLPLLATLLVAAGLHSLLAKGPAAKAVAPAAAAAPAAPKPPTPLGPPLRGGRGLVVGPPAAGAEASPAPPSSAGRPSPFGARPITTPEQLRRVLVRLLHPGTAHGCVQRTAASHYVQQTYFYGSDNCLAAVARTAQDEFEEGTAASPAQQPADAGYSPAAGIRLGTSSPLLGPAPVYRWVCMQLELSEVLLGTRLPAA